MTSDILHRVARGERAAVQACIERYGGLVWSLALRLSSSRADAEDAVQEVFISLWRSAGRFDPSRASEAGFVAMIARRRLIDRRRKAISKGEIAVDIDLDTIPSLDHERLDWIMEAKAATRAIEALPAERQKILRLAIYEGLTHVQIAEAMKLPLGTVKSHVRRGLATVREQLEASESEVTA